MNDLQKVVEITIDDKKYHMKPTFKALAAIEKELGISILGFITERGINNNIGVMDCYYVLKNGLEASGNCIDDEILHQYISNNLTEVIKSITEFLTISFYGNEEIEEKDAKKK